MDRRIYHIALETLQSAAPDLSESVRQAISRSIALKAVRQEDLGERADLFAAAPDMLEALKLVAETMYPGDRYRVTAYAAIAKAEGRGLAPEDGA